MGGCGKSFAIIDRNESFMVRGRFHLFYFNKTSNSRHKEKNLKSILCFHSHLVQGDVFLYNLKREN